MFVLDKLAWAVLQPGNLLTLCLVAGVIVARTRCGKVLIGLSALGFALLTVTPIGPAMMLVLEERFPQPRALPERIDGIVVLGGVVNPVLSSTGGTAFNCSTARLLDAVALARRHPEAKLALVGHGMFPVGYSDGGLAKKFIVSEGIAPERVIVEGKSRTTHENAVYAKRLMQPAPGGAWVLITSAFHMPRAVGAFRAGGWHVIPYPVDFSIDPGTDLRASFSLVDGLDDSTLAGHEWVGLVAYRLMGWSKELFPAPYTRAPIGWGEPRNASNPENASVR
jgi:uncharacterized SAM-binding protein YcdF (DUF218 family)